MKTLIYMTIGLIAAAALVGCGKSSSNNNNPYGPYGQYGQYGQYGGGCLPTGIALNPTVCQQYGYSWNGSSCVSPQGQVIAPGTCSGGYNSGYNGAYPYNTGYPYSGGYNYNYSYGYTGTYTTPYGAPYYIPTMPYYYNQRR